MSKKVNVKDLIVKIIPADKARSFVKKYHYSGKVVNNSVLHFGVFLNNRLEGVMQYGNPIDKRNVLPFVKGTKWNDMLELNRMAFSDKLPKNSESRSIAVSLRLIKKHYPNIEWVLSFADGTQCGDGTIYRASGFSLCGVNKNNTIVELPNGEVMAKHGTSKKDFTGAKVKAGFQLRYLYFINKEAKKRLTIPELPFSDIDRLGAGMYKGSKRVTRASADTLSNAAVRSRPARSTSKKKTGKKKTSKKKVSKKKVVKKKSTGK